MILVSYFKGDKRSDNSKTIRRQSKESNEYSTWLTRFFTQFGFYLLLLLGYLSEIILTSKNRKEKYREGYEILSNKFVFFYSKYVLYRMRDCFERAVCSVPGHEVTIRGRYFIKNKSFTCLTNSETKCLNLGSYNYLGFAETTGPCADHAIETIYNYGISTGSTRQQYGTCSLHDQLERLLADFLGVEDSITFGMGFATNSLTIPSFVYPECLVLSDEMNHNSMIVGFNSANVTVKIFKHNNVEDLETLLKEAIYCGQPYQKNNKYKPWKKILIFVEGIYSMEGSICRLPEIIALKKKYKAYLYLDEAHSIGAIGKHGRGVVDYHNCDPKDIDILMGTFTKSFAGTGGYLAGKKEMVNFFRENTYASKYGWALSPPVVAQIISVFNILIGKDGTNEGQKRIDRLSHHTRYFRSRLLQMGLILFGSEDSPVVPILTYYFSKCTHLSRKLFEEKIATVGVVYPGSALSASRIRICLSAGHSKEQLDYALEVINRLSDDIGLRYSQIRPTQMPIACNNKESVYQNGIKKHL